MSVIAKLIVRDIRNFGTGSLVELGCIATNDLMAAYAESESDRLFTRYSPWGEMKLHQPATFSLGKRDDAFYVMILAPEEVGDAKFPGAYARSKMRCISLTDFGDNAAKTVEFCESYDKEGRYGLDNFNWKMSVDNPPATSQFKPGKGDYWIAFYPAVNFTRDQAIAAAHAPAK